MGIVAGLVAGPSTSAPTSLADASAALPAAQPAATEVVAHGLDDSVATCPAALTQRSRPATAIRKLLVTGTATPTWSSCSPDRRRRSRQAWTAQDLHALLLRVVRAADLGLLLPTDADWIRAQAQATFCPESPTPTHHL
jgi:hypothetical protein